MDIPSAIQKCRDKGFNDKNIVVDVVLCSSKKIAEEDVSTMKSLAVLLRTTEIFSFDLAMRDLIEIGHIFPNVDLRYVVAPTVPLPSGSLPLKFKPDQIEVMIQQGIKDAADAVKLGHGKMLENILKSHYVEKVSAMMGRPVTEEEAVSVMNKIKEGEKRDYERMKKKFLGN